jgi:predicted nucleotidyltransferase
MPSSAIRTECRSTSTHPSSSPEQLEQVLGAVRDVLGPAVIGAYLFGSAVLGGLRPRSDLDVLVASRRRTKREEKQRLVDRLLEVSGRPLRPVEVTIVVQSDVRPWRYPPRMDFQYGEWLRDDFESGNLEPWPTTNPDLASLITMVLLAGRPLLGPAPAEVFDLVPRADLSRALVAGIGPLLDDLDSDTRNVILTLARIWSTVATDVIRSKDDAAAWALDRLPEEHRPVLAHARAVYLGDEGERWEDLEPRVRPHVDYVVGEIERIFLLRGGARSRGNAR